MYNMRIFLLVISALFPFCTSFNWVGLPTTPGSPVVGSRASPDPQKTALLEELKGYIQIKASKHKNSKSTTFDLMKLQEYLKDLNYQIDSLQAQIDQITKSNGFIGSNNNPATGFNNQPLPTMMCPPCPTCPVCPSVRQCPPPRPIPSCPPASSSSFTPPTTTRSTTPSEFESEENFGDGELD
ncbi:WASH complex subunit 3 isoform X2 [Folsomia candida]|nr:WASH complex subunit 3 isoform X2 [Folsomia candida]